MVESPPMENREAARFYLPELDGLRFIAFLLVFIHNAQYMKSNKIWTALHEYGWIGVDLFFCLSAFLITKLLINEFKQIGEVNIRAFYFRRILRIWPLYFFYIIIAAIFITQDHAWDLNITQHLAGLTTFTFNIVYVFLTPNLHFIFVHLWTISYEEQFYTFIPWAIKRLANLRKTSHFLLTAFLTGTIIRAFLIYYQAKHPVIYMLPVTHFEAMLCGVAIALGQFDRTFEKIKARWLVAIGVILSVLVFLLPNIYKIGWNLMLTYPLAGFGVTFIVFGFTRETEKVNITPLKTKLVVYLGKISFGLYIYHLISMSIMDNIFKHTMDISIHYYPIILFVGSLLLTIVLSVVSYTFLEKPFLKMRERYSSILTRPI